MSERLKLKEFLSKEFFGGFIPNPCYPTYLFYDTVKGFTHQQLTSGLTGQRFIIPCKYYSTWMEMYDDIKLYFDFR